MEIRSIQDTGCPICTPGVILKIELRVSRYLGCDWLLGKLNEFYWLMQKLSECDWVLQGTETRRIRSRSHLVTWHVVVPEYKPRKPGRK